MNNIIISKATPEGFSSICVVRVSGENASKFIKPLIKKDLKVQIVQYTKIYGFDKKFTDYAIVLFFKAPKSLTGEDVVEFHIHGSESISNRLINDLILLGAKIAKPGEFLERRYMNGKISLIECEMINNKIYYNYESMFKLTINSQKNIYLCIIKNSKFRINVLLICLEIIKLLGKKSSYKDFLFIKKFLKKFYKLLNVLLNKIKKIKYLKSKFEIMIMGKRNVGKSTLFNKLCLQYDSIVTNIPGTTKNTITKQIYFNSKLININDTAGLKIRTKNLIEKIGILKNINKIYKGNLILYLIDKFNLKEIFYNLPLNFFNKIRINEIIFIINKCDIFGKKEGIYKLKNLIIIFLSAKNSVIIYRIKCFLSKIIDNEKLLLNNELNYSNISVLFNNCKIFYREFCCNYDIIIEKLINFQKKVFKISGNYTNNNIKNSFFRNFCIGK
ncbi:GTPase [Candidatus Carsonella ruddii]|uniref:tRNA modification GTPase n=1 Tax=Candidatus Carsonella ruddii CE isolate Thao2000 TaxID=1202536 RepID=J7GVS7_CARRU|nr:GTPase [Candidatus Carsonella ruddii]AFP83476.1 tRNA modification GTPase [Candidatus Carsonella ruddii CE isolate Thao2000]